MRYVLDKEYQPSWKIGLRKKLFQHHLSRVPVCHQYQVLRYNARGISASTKRVQHRATARLLYGCLTSPPCRAVRTWQVVTELSSRSCSLCREPTSGFFTLTCSRVCLSCFQTDPRVKMCSLRCAQSRFGNRILRGRRHSITNTASCPPRRSLLRFHNTPLVLPQTSTTTG